MIGIGRPSFVGLTLAFSIISGIASAAQPEQPSFSQLAFDLCGKGKTNSLRQCLLNAGTVAGFFALENDADVIDRELKASGMAEAVLSPVSKMIRSGYRNGTAKQRGCSDTVMLYKNNVPGKKQAFDECARDISAFGGTLEFNEQTYVMVVKGPTTGLSRTFLPSPAKK